MQLAQVTRRECASGEQEPGVHGSLVQQPAQLLKVAVGVGEVGQPVQGGLVARLGQVAQGLPELGGLPELSLTGGHALPYRSGEGGPDVTAFAERITHAVEAECAAGSILMPRLTVEAGRAIVGDAEVTLYRVLAVKHGTRMSVVLDGGMSDGTRPARHTDIKRVGPGSAARVNR